MTTMYRKDGTPVEVPNEQVAEARAGGELFFQKGARIPVISPTGERGTIDQADLLGSVAQGFQLESEKKVTERDLEAKYGVVGAPALAGAAGVARGLTFSGSDLALSDEDRETARKLEEAYPNLSTGAELTGAIAPIVLSGGTGAIAEGAVLAPTALLSRGAAAVGERVAGRFGGRAIARGVARYAAEGVVEGAAYGAGEGLHEAVMTGGDPHSYAERILAGAARGAVTGGVLGGGLGLVTGSVQATVPRLLKRVDVGKISDDMAVRAIDPSKRAARELGDRAAKVGQDLKELGIVRPGASTETMLEAASAARVKSGKRLGEILRAADEAGASVTLRDVEGALGDLLKKRSRSLTATGQAAARSIRKEIEPLLSKLRPKEGVVGRAGEVVGQKPVGLEQLHGMRAEIDDKIRWAAATSDPVQKDLRELRGRLEGLIESKADDAFKRGNLGDFALEYKSAKRAYGSSTWAEKQLTDNLARGQTNHFMGLLDRVSGTAGVVAGLATGSAGIGMVGGAAMGLLSKALREKGAGVIATALNRVNKTDARIRTAVARFGSTAPKLKAIKPRKGIVEVSRADRTLRRRASETRLGAYRRNVREVMGFDASRAAERLGNLASEMPSTAAAVVAKMAEANQYLVQHLPTGAVTNDPLVPSENVLASNVDIERFARIKRVVDDPLSVLDDMEAGTLSVASVRTLRDVYPKLYDQIRTETMVMLTKRGETIPFSKRAALGTLFDFVAVPSQDPARKKQIQQVYQPRHEQPQGPQPSRGPTAPSKIVNNFRSEIQSLEAGDFHI